MIAAMLRRFCEPTVADVLRRQLAYAQRERVEHMAAAEHHAALARMFQERAERVGAELSATTKEKP